MPSRRRLLASVPLLPTLTGCLARDSGDGGDESPSEPRQPSTEAVAQFQYDARNTGATDGGVPDRIGTRWSRQLDPVTGGLAATGDTLLVAASRSLVALDTSDGTERWDVRVGIELGGPPAVTDDLAYVSAWNGADGVPRGVLAVDVSDGSERWRAIPDVGVNTPPTLADGQLYVGGSLNSEHVIALDARTGDELWRFRAGQHAPAPAVADGVVFAGGGEEHAAYALDAEDGDELWRFEAGERVWTAPTILDDTVYVGTRNGRLHALAASDGAELWSANVGGVIRHSIAATDESVFVPTGDALVALTPDGDELWNERTSGPLAPSVTESEVVVATDQLSCLDVTDGSHRWSRDVPSRTRGGDAVYSGIRSPAIVAEDAIYLGAHGGDVFALERQD